MLNLALILALSASVAVAHSPTELRSPWDVQPVKVTGARFTSREIDPLPKDIAASDYYSDKKHSIIDPARYAAYNAAAKHFQDTMRIVEAAADNFQATGSRKAADVAFRILLQNAQAGAMTGKMSANQAHYVQNWTLGALATTWLKVRCAKPGTPEDRQAVVAWLRQVAGSVMDYFDRGRAKGSGDAKNNHYAWAGFSVMAVGIAANDRAMFDWGVAGYDDAVSHIDPDGVLPLEMARGQRALHYHVFTLAPLVTIAEFGMANGLDLYARNDGALKRLVDRTISGLEDNRYFEEKSGAAQDTPAGGKIKSEDIIYMQPYLRRFPNPIYRKLLQSATLRPYSYLGGMPPP